VKKDLAYIGFGGAGKQVRDFLHVDDFCDLVIAQIENLAAFHGKTLNAGGGNAVSTSLCELTRLCEEVTGNRLHFRSESENRPADVRVFITDHRKLSALNGWKPLRSAQSTIGDIFEWVRANETLMRNLIAT
jgi:CDP-paratose 2-epimerase